MSDLNTVFGLPQEDEQEPDYNAIFGGGAADDPPILAGEPDLAERAVATNEKEPARKTEKETTPDREEAPTAKKSNQSTKREAKEVEEELDLFSAFNTQADTPPAAPAAGQVSLFDKPAVFSYKSMPEREADRRLLARLVRADHDLLGIPGFYTRYGEWTLAGPNGFLIPVRDKDGLIQGLKIRLDSETSPNRKYRWLSSRDKHLQNGTRSYSWIHVTGDRTRKRAYITEGPLKGDVASYLANDALFVCTGGVNATRGLKETLEDLGITEVVEAMDMDQMVNPQVRNGILTMRKEILKIPNIKYSKYSWNPAYKGVDDYFLSRVAAM